MTKIKFKNADITALVKNVMKFGSVVVNSVGTPRAYSKDGQKDLLHYSLKAISLENLTGKAGNIEMWQSHDSTGEPVWTSLSPDVANKLMGNPLPNNFLYEVELNQPYQYEGAEEIITTNKMRFIASSDEHMEQQIQKNLERVKNEQGEPLLETTTEPVE